MKENAPLASFENAYNEAKEAAAKETKTILIRFELTEEELAKREQPMELPNAQITFARTFVMGVGRRHHNLDDPRETWRGQPPGILQARP